jgi:hypothetical protein
LDEAGTPIQTPATGWADVISDRFARRPGGVLVQRNADLQVVILRAPPLAPGAERAAVAGILATATRSAVGQQPDDN